MPRRDFYQNLLADIDTNCSYKAIEMIGDYYLVLLDGLRGPLVRLVGRDRERFLSVYAIVGQRYECSAVFQWGGYSTTDIAGYKSEHMYTIPGTNVVVTAFWPTIDDELLWESNNKER